MKSKKMLAMTALTALLLASCGKNPPADPAGASATDSESTSQDETASDQGNGEKINAYTQGYNDLVGMFYGNTNGLEALLEEYKSQKISSMKSANADTRLVLYLNTSMLRNSLASLNEGLELKGSGATTKVDAAAKAMVENGEELLKQATSFEGYIKSKKYLEDGLAQARADDPAIIQRWERLNADFHTLGSELDLIERANRTIVIARLKKEGDTAGVNVKEGTYAANDLLALFDKASDFKDAAKLAKADALAQQIEKNTTALKAELDAKPDSENHSDDMGAYDDLTALIGEYRQLKAGGDMRGFEEMVSQYNELVNRRD